MENPLNLARLIRGRARRERSIIKDWRLSRHSLVDIKGLISLLSFDQSYMTSMVLLFGHRPEQEEEVEEEEEEEEEEPISLLVSA